MIVQVICYLIGGGLVLTVLLYLCFELHYFMRLLLAMVLAKYFKKKVHILDEVTVKGICLTNDIDTFIYHMNNARFIRELDFARADLYQRTGLYPALRRNGGNVAMGACTIRYRRFLKLFSVFLIKSKVLCWDEKSIFIEHQFITPSDNFVCAIVVSRTQILDCDIEEVMKELMARDPTRERPEMPLEIVKWLEYNDISSAKLKSEIISPIV